MLSKHADSLSTSSRRLNRRKIEATSGPRHRTVHFLDYKTSGHRGHFTF
jgi:hypothetical protein